MKRILSLGLVALLASSAALARNYIGDYDLGDTIDCKFGTVQPSTGASYTLAGTPAVAAYVGNSTTEITAGITLTADFDSRTGLNSVRVVATSANGYTAGTNVDIVITTGTVDSVSVVGQPVCSFTLRKTAAPGVGHKGTAQAGDTDEITLASTASSTDDFYVGATVAPVGGTGAGQSGRLITAYNGTSKVATVAPDWEVSPSSDTVYELWQTAPAPSGSGGGGDATAANQTTIINNLATVDNNVDTLLSRLGTPSNLGGGATIAANLSDIESQTDDIGVAGAGLTAADDAVMTRLGSPAGASIAADIAAVKAETATIVADTNELQTDWADGGRLDLLLDGASSAGDPWTTALPGSYTSGQAGYIIGNSIDAAISSRASQSSLDDVPTAAENAAAVIAAQGIITGTCDSGSTSTCVDDALTQADNDQLEDRLICFDDGWCALITTFSPGADQVTTTKVAPSTRASKSYTIFPATLE